MKVSDLVVAVDNQTVDDPNAFGYRFATRPLGGVAQIEVRRAGKLVKLSVPLETAPDTNRDEVVIRGRSPFEGAKVSNITPAVADEMRIDSSVEGVVVVALADDGAAANVGFRKGDVIVAVNGRKIETTGELASVARERSRLWRITILRGGRQIQVTLGG